MEESGNRGSVNIIGVNNSTLFSVGSRGIIINSVNPFAVSYNPTKERVEGISCNTSHITFL